MGVDKVKGKRQINIRGVKNKIGWRSGGAGGESTVNMGKEEREDPRVVERLIEIILRPGMLVHHG